MPCYLNLCLGKFTLKKKKKRKLFSCYLCEVVKYWTVDGTVCHCLWHSESAAVPALYPTNNHLLCQIPSLYADRTHKIFGKVVGRDCMPKKYL